MPHPPHRALALCTAAALLLVPLVARAQWPKQPNVRGYQFSHLTANSTDDSSPRVSANGLVTWGARYNLPGAVSGSSDLEIFFWDGATVTQITDDDLEQTRPVVNALGDLAWQLGDGEEQSEIFAEVGGVRSRLTEDPSPVGGTIDRYPDINDAGVVVWGRLIDNEYFVCVWNPLVGGPFAVIGRGYRPHLNNGGHVHAAGISGIFDLTYQFVPGMFPPQSYGYSEFRRSEINQHDQLAIEATRPGLYWADATGPRDILFWDGSQLRKIYRSPGLWHGRPDLNAAGVIVWEGFGGLPGSASGKIDEEIFVYDPRLRQVVQLTDDDVDDTWPTVTDDGVIYWAGNGSYPGAPGNQLDRDVFRAVPVPDADDDGVLDAADSCALRANPEQLDSGGFASSVADGIGDACQCGDVSDDGLVDASDVQSFRDALASGQIDAVPSPAKCRVNGGWAPCSLADLTILRRALQSAGTLAPALEQTCDAALQF